MLAFDEPRGTGIEWIENRRAYENSTTIRRPGPFFPIGKLRTLQGRVEGKHLHVELDGEKLWDLEIPKDVLDPKWVMRPGWMSSQERLQMSVSTWKSEFVIQEARFRPLN
ncbi:MAG: hypothetical protein JWM11_1253 [Planctomycetaceae bacterium]|nr:hypothetical protein [Planctomycetaceae bacterium]